MSGVNGFIPRNRVERLARILKENQEKLYLDRDGRVSVNLFNEEAVNAILEQIQKLEGVNTVSNSVCGRHRTR